MELITQDDANFLNDDRQRFTEAMPIFDGEDEHNVKTAISWVRDSYLRGVEAILETGRRLAVIRTEFKRRKTQGGSLWSRFIGSNGTPGGNLPFKESQILNFIRAWESFGPPALVAASKGEIIEQLSHDFPVPLAQLPANIEILAGLGSVKVKEPDRFKEMVISGVIRPDLKTREFGDIKYRKSRTHSSEAVALIDGEDICGLAIGRCKTMLRRKQHEVSMLRRVVTEYGHLGDEKSLGDVCSPSVLADLAALLSKFETHGRD